jgi:hypothetical protein
MAPVTPSLGPSSLYSPAETKAALLIFKGSESATAARRTEKSHRKRTSIRALAMSHKCQNRL